MVIEYMNRSRATSDLLAFLADNKCSDTEFDLLRFMGRHPQAKLSFYVIIRAFRIAAIDLGNALMALVERGLLVHCLDDNGLVTYSLSGEERARGYIRKLASLDWSVAMALKKELKDRTVCFRIYGGTANT